MKKYHCCKSCKTYYSSRGRTNGTAESSEVHCIHTVKDKAEMNTLTSHLKLVMTALIVHLFFNENQIRRLMDESPYDDRKLEVLRASCTGQPREMVNLFCVPMKNVSTWTRIEKALDRLRQKYGVSGGLTSEPKIIAIRNGPKILSDLNSLKMYNEDLCHGTRPSLKNSLGNCSLTLLVVCLMFQNSDTLII